MDEESKCPPAPPKGYRKHDPDYEQPWYVTVLLAGWLVGVFVVILGLVLGIRGPETAVRIIRVVLQPESAGEWVAYIGWVAATFGTLLVGHEALHALVGRWLGLRAQPRFEYRHPLSWSPEIVTYGEFQSRADSLAISLAPLFVLTPVSIIALVAGQHLWVVASATVLALGNSAGAVGDLASAWILWKLPDGELIHHDSEGRRQYYTPIND